MEVPAYIPTASEALAQQGLRSASPPTAEPQLGLATVLKITEAVWADVASERLPEAILQIALEETGSDRGVLIVPRHGTMQVVAEATADGPSVRVNRQTRPIDAVSLPAIVVNHVIRTHEPVVLSGTGTAHAWLEDPYFAEKGPCSVFCRALLRQTGLLGVLYLEHAGLAHHMTKARLAVMTLLAAEASRAIENRLTEQQLRRSEAYLAEAQRLGHAGSYALDVATLRYIYWSEEEFRIWDFDPRDGPPDSQAVRQRIHPAERAAVLESAWTAFRAGHDKTSEMRIVLPNGTVKHVVSIAHPILDASGELRQVFGTHIDLTEQKRAEESLRRSEAYLAEAQALSHTGSFAFDIAEDRYVYWSDEMFRLWGLDPNKAPPDRAALLTHVHPDDHDGLIRVWTINLHERKDASVRFRVVRPDGTVRYVRGVAHPVLNERGELVRTIGTMMDVTDRKRAEEERERLQQLEADLAHINRVSMMGELAAALAHEIKQPLTAAAANAQASVRWLERATPDLTRASKAARNTARDVVQAAEIIDRVRALYGRGKVVRRERVEVNDVIREIGGLLHTRAERQGVVIRTEADSAVPAIQTDRVQLQQVLMNLMVNGIEAMQAVGGTLTVRTARAPEGDVVVAVQDEGVGLPADGSERLFEAFVTTKPAGTGLGLAISRRIVEAQGGRLWATPNVERGATFQFTLPGAEP